MKKKGVLCFCSHPNSHLLYCEVTGAMLTSGLTDQNMSPLLHYIVRILMTWVSIRVELTQVKFQLSFEIVRIKIGDFMLCCGLCNGSI